MRGSHSGDSSSADMGLGVSRRGSSPLDWVFGACESTEDVEFLLSAGGLGCWAADEGPMSVMISERMEPLLALDRGE